MLSVRRQSTVLSTATRQPARRREVSVVSAAVVPATDLAMTSWLASVVVSATRAGSTPTVRRLRPPTWRASVAAAPALPAALPSRTAPVAFDVPATSAR